MPLKNFDKITREKREIQVGGQKADVTRIPSRVMLELAEATESGKISEDNPDSFHYTLRLVEKIMTPSNPEMTADFLLDNTDFETLIEIVEYVMEPVQQKMEEHKEQQKNVQAQASKKPLKK